jgi:hypothetical protein
MTMNRAIAGVMLIVFLVFSSVQDSSAAVHTQAHTTHKQREEIVAAILVSDLLIAIYLYLTAPEAPKKPVEAGNKDETAVQKGMSAPEAGEGMQPDSFSSAMAAG